MKVTIVGPSLRCIGGQAVQADLLLRHWKGDPDLEMTFIPSDPKLPRGLEWVERIRYLRTLARTSLFLVELWRGIREAELVHIFSASYWSFLLGPAPAWLAARLRHKKSLINYRSGEAPDHLRRSKIARAVLAHADQIVVPSQYLVNVFGQHGLTAKVVPNIVDLGQFSYRVRAPIHPWLVCTRMFEPYYQVDLVVRSFAEVSKVFPEARLCLVGSGSQENEIRKIVAGFNLQNVEFAGTVARGKIGKYYDQSDIFVNGSRLDNMPVSIIEAFASGTPVVTTAAEGVRYLVEHERTGLLCDPHDWKALAENVIRMISEPDMALRLARNAHEESLRYCWTAVRERWLEVYRSVLLLESHAGHGPGQLTMSGTAQKGPAC